MWFCSDRSTRVYCGFLVLGMVSSSWMSATQFLKATYYQSNSTNSSSVKLKDENITFSAPFLTCWFCMMWTILFFPLYMFSITICSCWDKKNSTNNVLQDALHKFKEAGITLGNYEANFAIRRNAWFPGVLLFRSFLFCLLSVTTNYLYISSLRYYQETSSQNKSFLFTGIVIVLLSPPSLLQMHPLFTLCLGWSYSSSL